MQAADRDACASDISLYAFEPHAARARRVETSMRVGLADSLSAALCALGGDTHSSGADLIARVRAGAVAPVVFGAYTELVEAIFADDLGAAKKIAQELCLPAFGQSDGLRILTLNDRYLGKDQTARYRRLVDEDQEVGLALRPLAEGEFAVACGRIKAAVNLLESAAPEVAGELHALVREIVVVDKAGNWPFGASSFQLWGALFIKLRPWASRVEIAESLAHECAHALLFGFGMGAPLVENEPQALYPSPLRSDPRPMDGVVHATYVIARMYYTVSRLLESGLLTEEETREARAAKERNALGYAEGISVVEAEARWTPAGLAALASAKTYMADHTSRSGNRAQLSRLHLL